jgi:preprotein translocase subunit YajC
MEAILSNLIANATPATPGAGAGPLAGIMQFLPIILIFVLFYVMFIIPQRKEQKKLAEYLKNLKKGDEIRTNSGIYGTIVGLNEKDDSVSLKIAENVKIEIQRSAIAGPRAVPEKVETKA